MSAIFDINVTRNNDENYSLSELKGKTLLVVNTASQCRFTSQYEALEVLHQKYKDAGLVILAFPCNQFAKQEPGIAEKIESFCKLNYGVSFPLHKKIEVNGQGTTPLFQYLKSQAKGLLGSKSIKWNFTKFLISPDGLTIERFAPMTNPIMIEDQIKRYITDT